MNVLRWQIKGDELRQTACTFVHKTDLLFVIKEIYKFGYCKPEYNVLDTDVVYLEVY